METKKEAISSDREERPDEGEEVEINCCTKLNRFRFPWHRSYYLLWVILAAAAINVIFLGGKRRAFGVFVAELHVNFPNITLAELNWIGDSYAAFGYLTTPLSSTLILAMGRRYALFQFIGSLFILLSCLASANVPSPHLLFLTHTVFHGIGSSLVLSCIGLVVNEHFSTGHPYRLLATTLVSGGSVASIVFVQMFAQFIQLYDWRNAFYILGAIYFIVNTSACLFFRKNDELADVVQQVRTTTICSRSTCMDEIRPRQWPLLILWTLDRIITSVVTYGILLNLTDYVRRTGTNLVASSTLTMLFAAGEATTYLIGAVCMAITKNIFHNKLKYVLLVTSFCMSVFLVAWEFTTEITAAAYFFSFATGFSMGPSITFLFPAGEELTSLPGHMAYSFSLGGMGFGMAISPLLSAVIAQKFNYRWFFLIQGCLFFAKSCCLLAATIFMRMSHLDQDSEYESLADGTGGESKATDDDDSVVLNRDKSERTPFGGADEKKVYN